MTHDPLSDYLKKKPVVEPGVKDSVVRCDRNLDWQLIGEGVGVKGYFVVHSTENGVLWQTDMSMEQGWEMYFPPI